MSSTLLEVKNLSISFAGIKAVQDVSFDVKRGEILALIGPNGSGKSTTVNMISGVYRPDSGRMIFDGTELTNKQTIAQRAHLGIGRTFQSPKPFANLTVYGNIFPIALQKYNHKIADEKTKDILKLTGMYDLIDTPASKLPIEKRKWLDLARVLAIEPKLVMMDEVIAGLNPSEMEESLVLVRQINKEGITVLFIEHVMKAVVSLCTRAVVLNGGKLLSEGPPQEVLNDPKVVEAYIGGGGNDAAEH